MTDLEALVVAAYVFADEYPVPVRPGRPPAVSDAELVALSVAQAAIGIGSDRQAAEAPAVHFDPWGYLSAIAQGTSRKRSGLRERVERGALGASVGAVGHRLAGVLDRAGFTLDSRLGCEMREFAR
jgi:hypothetical protein